MHPIVLAVIVVAFCVGLLAMRGSRVAGSIVLLGLAASCGFGFLASFEPPGSIGWKVGYGLVGVCSLIGAIWPWVASRLSGAEPS